MPAPVLAALCVMVMFLPAIVGLVPAIIIKNDTLRVIVVPIGWAVAVGAIVALHMYGFSLHPGWWDGGPMIPAVMLGVIVNLIWGSITARIVFGGI